MSKETSRVAEISYLLFSCILHIRMLHKAMLGIQASFLI